MISTSLTALVVLLGIALYPFFANHLPNQRQNAGAVIGVILLGIPIVAADTLPQTGHGTPVHSALMVLSFLFFGSAFLGRRRGFMTAEKSALLPFGVAMIATMLDAITHTPETYLALVAVQAICLLAITKSYQNLPKVILLKAVFFSMMYCLVNGLFHVIALDGYSDAPNMMSIYLAYSLLLISAVFHMAFQDFSRTRTKRSRPEQTRIDQDLMKMAFRGRRVLKDFRHDLRQPLSTLGILASVGKAISQDPEVTARYQHIQTAQKALKNMLEEFFDELAAAIRYPLDDNRTQLETVSVNDVLGPLIEEYRMLAEVKQLQIRHVPTDVLVLSNREALSKIVRNGLDNAIKYTNKGGIVVGIRRKRGRICLQIADTGSGVENDKVAAHNKGWGHGSNIVRDLSDQIQARTACRNRYYNGKLAGSVFEIILPSESEVIQRHKLPGRAIPSTFDAKVMAFNHDQLLEIQRHVPAHSFDKLEFSLIGAYRTYVSALRKGMSSVYFAYAGNTDQKAQAMDQLRLLASLLDYEPCCILLYNAIGEDNPQIEFTREMIRIPVNPRNPSQSLSVISEMFPGREHEKNSIRSTSTKSPGQPETNQDKKITSPS